MRSVVLVLTLVLAGCTGAAEPFTTSATNPVPSTTTTAPAMTVEVQGCNTPPVPFSGLCEVYELLDTWHVDQPVDASDLAARATAALTRDRAGIPEASPPRTLFCAVPHPAFTDFCHRLGEVVSEGVALGPLMDHVVAQMVDDAHGPFTYYLSADQLTAFRDNGLVGGLGLLLDATDAAGSKCARLGPSCPLRIVVALDDNPGQAAGLVPGDVIVAIDGTPVDGGGFAATAARIAGEETGTVSLTVIRDGQELEFDIARAPLVIPNVEWAVPYPGVGYLRIPDFESDVPGLVSEALEELEGQYTTMVVDLRDNPGGLVSSAEAIASEFIPSGPLFSEEYADGTETVESLGPGGLATSGRLLVLVNGGTASAAEMLGGALRDRRDAMVIGTPTFGKNAVQIRFDLRNGGRLDVVIARWLTPEGASVGNGGLEPDIQLELPDEMTILELIDTVLEAAG